MAGEEQKASITTANSPASWVQAFYGDDAYDYKKVDKLKHIKHVGQFAAFCYVVSKNTKQAHTDFFEANYTTVDKMYARASELILKLLYVKFSEERPLTADDFDRCGGAELFNKGSNPDYGKICEDYIGSSGMVEMCQTLIPVYEDNAITAKGIKELNDDFDAVKRNHTMLLAKVDPEGKEGTLSRQQIFDLFSASSDCASNAWKMHKKAKTEGEKAHQKDLEDAFFLRYDLAKKTGKVALIGTTAVASIGAIVGGVFWPALLLLPVHSLSKHWVPDWFKSMGAMWGNVENRFKDKRAIARAAAFQAYIVAYAEAKKNGTKLKLPLKHKLRIRKADTVMLNKQAKQVVEGLTLEGSDGKVHESAMEVAARALANSKSFGQLLNGRDKDNLVPADAGPVLTAKIKALQKESVTFENFIEIARTYKNWQSNLSTDAQLSIEMLYSEKLLECSENLIFKTKMKTLTAHKDKVEKMFADDSAILEPVKTVMPEALEKIKRYVMLAGKELSGLKDEWKGETLYEYIYRDLDVIENIDVNGRVSVEVDGERVEENLFNNPSNDNLVAAVNLINALKVNPDDYREVISGSKKLSDIQAVIGEIENSDDKKKISSLLTSRMTSLFNNAYREDSRASYEAILGGSFTGKNTLNDVFDKIKNMTYETVGNAEYTQLIKELTSPTKINPPAMGRYLCSKISKQAYDVFDFYVNDKNIAEFKKNLPALIEYLQKLNSCSLLNQQQKAKLTANVQCYVSEAFDKYVKNMSTDFIGQYDLETVRKYHEEDYSSGGLKTLFRTDKSSTVVGIEKSLSSLKTAMNDVHTNLKFNGKTICAIDRGIIGKILLRDEGKGFEEIRVRPADDALVKFLASDLKVSSSYTKADLTGKDSTSIVDVIKGSDAKPTPLYQLQQKFTQINDTNLTSEYDQYAAVVALKNKAIYEFRQCLLMLSYTYGGGNAATWLGTDDGREMYEAVVAVWSDGDDSLFSKIDKKMEELSNGFDPKFGISKPQYLSETEMKNHTGTYSLSALQAEELSK